MQKSRLDPQRVSGCKILPNQYSLKPGGHAIVLLFKSFPMPPCLEELLQYVSPL